MPLLGGASKLSQSMVMATDPRFTNKPYTIFDFALPPLDAGCRLQLRGDGTVWALRDQALDINIGRWDNGLGTLTLGDYDLRMDTVSGSLGYTGGESADVWVPGVVNMFWGVQETGIGISDFEGNLRIRPSGGGSDFDIVGVTMMAEATP